MWPGTDDTLQLLDGVRDGNRDAADLLWERHRAALRRMIALRMDRALAGRVDASDVVQDVLLEASGRLANYLENPSMPFHLWLRQLAQDRMIDLHRRHRVAARRSVDREQPLQAVGGSDQSAFDLAAQLRASEMTPAAAAVWHELEARFFAAVEGLAAQDQEIVLMRHFEHLTNSDVAAALDISTAAAGMRYLRAMRRLRAILDDGSQSDV